MHKNTRPPVRVREVLPVALSTFRRSLPQILNYQLWTKLLFSGLLLPGFWLLVRFLMQSQGMLVITNSTLWEFMLRKEGAIVLAVALLLIFLGIIIELFGFVTISARTLHDQPEASYLSLVGKNIRLIPKFLGFGGLLLVVYLLVVVPLSGAGVGLSFISVRIPNFIGQAIEANPLYLLGYALLLLALLVLGIRWIFTLHYIVIAKYRPLAAMLASARLYRANRRSFLKIIIVIALLGVLITGLLLTGWAVVVFHLIDMLDFDRASARGIMLGLLMLQMVSGFLATILYVPFDVHILTILFYRFVKSSPEDAKFAERVPQLPKKSTLPLSTVCSETGCDLSFLPFSASHCSPLRDRDCFPNFLPHRCPHRSWRTAAAVSAPPKIHSGAWPMPWNTEPTTRKSMCSAQKTASTSCIMTAV